MDSTVLTFQWKENCKRAAPLAVIKQIGAHTCALTWSEILFVCCIVCLEQSPLKLGHRTHSYLLTLSLKPHFFKLSYRLCAPCTYLPERSHFQCFKNKTNKTFFFNTDFKKISLCYEIVYAPQITSNHIVLTTFWFFVVFNGLWGVTAPNECIIIIVTGPATRSSF